MNSKTFVVHMAIREQKKMLVHSKKQAQVGTLLFDKTFTNVLAEYSNYSNIFLTKYTTKLLEKTRINEYTIKLKKGQQSPFESISSLELIELEALKTYIKTNLTNGFIWSSKSSARALILFDKKLNRNFYLYVDYWGFNNIIIKNRYLLSLIGKLLD